MKGIKKGEIRQLMIPTANNPNNDTSQHGSDNWIQINDTEKVFELLLEQNAKMLTKSKNGIAASGALGELIGHNAENEGLVDQILDGSANLNDIINEYPHIAEEARRFIQQMKRDSRVENNFQSEYDETHFIETFKRTRETTSCGPSGLHMSHWKADTEHTPIAWVHAFFLWAAFALGTTYDRWAVSYHCMLQKLDKPYIHKLRIIQLFEGDFNGGLKYLLGKRLMEHLVKNGTIDEHAYGSIPGKSSQEAMQTLQFIYENHRIMKRDLVALFNDAAGCYDRV